MNCANHPDRERAAFCQNCGKPLCTECIRALGTSIFCEPCHAARVATISTPGFTPGAVPPRFAPSAPSEPNPGLAALLGFIPGVGAMYNEQYAKGIVHLVVFAILVSLASDVNGIFGLFIAGWICYMVIEAHHTARARRDGTPLPNPFGLNDLSERLGFGRAWPAAAPFAANPGPAAPPGAYAPPVSSFVDSGPVPPYTPPYGSAPPYTYVPPASSWGAPQDYAYGPPPVPPVPGAPPVPPYPDPNLPYYRRFPVGAIWLIALGLLFLFGNTGVFVIHARHFGPLVLIAIGVWVFVRRMTATGDGFADVGDPNYHWRLVRACRGSVWLVLAGILWLLDAFHILTWNATWPLFLIAGGIMLFFKRVLYGYPPPPYDPAAYGPSPGAPYTPPTPPVASTGLVRTHSDSTPTSNQEGR